MAVAAFAAALALVTAAPAASASTPDWTKALPVTLVSLPEGDMATDIEVAADASVWFIELKGDVRRFDPATNKTEVVHHVDNVKVGNERGLVGFALAKDFATTGTFFLYYTQDNGDPDGGTNRLVRVTDGEETLLLTVTGAKEHNGGRIVVDKDGNLFVGTGENQLRDPAQSLDSNLGKILHLTPDGEPVAGNVKGLIHSYGHRNPYGLAYDAETGRLWETENSGWRRDEVNVIQKGGNYGYPECEGNNLNGLPGPADKNPCPTTKGYVFPAMTFYEHDAVAPTGATFWRGEFYWGSLNEGSIHHTWQDPATKEWKDAKVLVDQLPILDLAVGPDDALYVATVTGILRIALPDEDVGPGNGDDLGDAGALNPGAGVANKGAGAASFLAVAGALAAGLIAQRRRSS